MNNSDSWLKALPRPFFVLAPMDDVTDSVFRRVVASLAPPDVFYTEFVNVDGLQSPGRPKLEKKIRVVAAEERPIIAQLWGKQPENFRKTAAELIAMGFAGIDLNMGCPAKSEVANGTCSALINDRPLAHDVIEATRQGIADALASVAAVQNGLDGRRPSFSVKTRIGFSGIDHSWPEFLLGHDLDMLVVHGRTRKEMSKVPAHWDEIGLVREMRDRLAPRTLVVGNGDVRDRAHGSELAEQYGLDGIMIGRGLFHDPYAFASSVEAGEAGAGGGLWESVGREERLRLFERHIRLFAETWQLPAQDGQPRYERAIYTLNKFCKIYINGFDGAKELREQLMFAGSTDELLRILGEAQKSSR